MNNPIILIGRSQDQETIKSLRGTLAVEIAERNRYKNLSDNLVKVINGLRLPKEVLATN